MSDVLLTDAPAPFVRRRAWATTAPRLSQRKTAAARQSETPRRSRSNAYKMRFNLQANPTNTPACSCNSHLDLIVFSLTKGLGEFQ